MSFVSIFIILFLIMNSIGHITNYLDLVDTFNKARRQKIILREMLFALIIMIGFHYAGEFLLDALELSTQTVSLAGGLILFLIAIRMIFPQSKAPAPAIEKQEPFVFPIATPMIAGPSILTTIMLYAHQEPEDMRVIFAILLAWIFSIIILFFAQEVRELVGKRALIAVERLMGLLLTMMAVEMVLRGISDIIKHGIA